MGIDKQVGDALLAENGRAGNGAGASLADRIARRERRRVHAWAIATATLWILTALYFLGLLWAYMVFIHPVLNEFLTNEEYRHQDLRDHAFALIGGLKALLLWPLLLLLAAACTTIFTLASRRATLRQIRASLAEISEQLRSLAIKP